MVLSPARTRPHRVEPVRRNQQRTARSPRTCSHASPVSKPRAWTERKKKRRALPPADSLLTGVAEKRIPSSPRPSPCCRTRLGCRIVDHDSCAETPYVDGRPACKHRHEAWAPCACWRPLSCLSSPSLSLLLLLLPPLFSSTHMLRRWLQQQRRRRRRCRRGRLGQTGLLAGCGGHNPKS